MSRRRQKKIDPLEQAFEAALSPGTFISYAGAWSFVNDAQNVASQIEEIITREPGRAALLFETFIAACHEKAEDVDFNKSGDRHLFSYIYEKIKRTRTKKSLSSQEPIRQIQQPDETPWPTG